MQTMAFLDYLAENPATSELGHALTDVLVHRRVLSLESAERDAECRAAG